MINTLDRILRRIVPSLAKASYNPLFKLIVNCIGAIPGLFFRELRCLPPNHLRVRIGVGNRIFFNHLVYLNTARNFWYNAFASGIVRLDSNIVDIGCGCGRFAQHLRDYSFGSETERYSGTYTGIDVDEELLDWNRRNFPTARFNFVMSCDRSSVYSALQGRGAIYCMPLDNESQDFVFSTSLFTHLLEDELVNYVRETYRVLRPGGVMQMTVFCIDMMREQGTLGGRFTFRHKAGNAYIESRRYPEAAVAFEREFLLGVASQIGFSSAEVIAGGQDILRCVR